MITERVLAGILAGMTAAGSLVILLAVVMWLNMLDRAGMPMAVGHYTGNLVLTQVICIFSMLASKIVGMTSAANMGFCGIVVFLEDTGLYVTSLLFMFMILDRMAAFLNGRLFWRQQTTKQNLSTSVYIILFCWVLGMAAAVPSAAVAAPNSRWERCEIPVSYAAIDMIVKLWFVLLAPVVLIMAVIIQSSYHRDRERIWYYARRVFMFYTACFVMMVPYYFVRVMLSDFALVAIKTKTGNSDGCDSTFLDYLNMFTHVIYSFKLVVFALFIVLFCSINPMETLEECLERADAERQSRSEASQGERRLPINTCCIKLIELIKQYVSTLSKATRDNSGERANLPENAEDIGTTGSDQLPTEVTVTPNSSAVFSTGGTVSPV
ncbi:Rh107 [macacine betaherpesvirus 3]|uniref:RhUL78 n=1 Tax=Rhesus cytomegalovirus (strain 68-1) TaxID=47929 RepID=Q2FAK6_RHCM6|nr:rhUL78 [macacine betaherpesvirus 3]QQL11303.1 Rh107 [macacine betaherpesvirus 3]QXV50453.1 envelope protein UL78 [macacine betaherpesvirus 3]